MPDEAKYAELKYPWRRFVVDAFMELRHERLLLKINAAERAVSARLCDPTPADNEERFALKDALRRLRILMSEQEKKRNESDRMKKDIA